MDWTEDFYAILGKADWKSVREFNGDCSICKSPHVSIVAVSKKGVPGTYACEKCYEKIGRTDSEVLYDELTKLTKNGVAPEDVPKIRLLCENLHHVRAVSVAMEPMLATIEAADKAALYALAALGDRQAVLELGHFGNMTTREAVDLLKKFRARPSG